MKIKETHFPHPVLSDFSDEYVNSAFNATVQCTPEDKTFKFHVSFQLENQGLEKLINNKLAQFMIHLECVPTNTFIAKKTVDMQIEFNIPAGDIHAKVQGYAFVVASESIDNYKNAHFHLDFEGENFLIQKGDILAIGPKIIIFIEKEPIKNFDSIFQLRKTVDTDAPAMTVECEDSNKIVITLSEENYLIYQRLKKTPKLLPLFHSLFAVPALCSAIELIKQRREHEDLDSLLSYSWFRTINKRLLEIGEDIESLSSLDSPIEIAQEIIDFPLTKALKVIEDYTDQPVIDDLED
jgi:hypothetical protein